MAETILATLTVDETSYTIAKDVGIMGNDLLIVHIVSRRIAFVKTMAAPHKWRFPVGLESFYLPPAIIVHLMMWMT